MVVTYQGVLTYISRDYQSGVHGLQITYCLYNVLTLENICILYLDYNFIE